MGYLKNQESEAIIYRVTFFKENKENKIKFLFNPHYYTEVMHCFTKFNIPKCVEDTEIVIANKDFNKTIQSFKEAIKSLHEHHMILDAFFESLNALSLQEATFINSTEELVTNTKKHPMDTLFGKRSGSFSGFKSSDSTANVLLPSSF